jgi:hypothetical protein
VWIDDARFEVLGPVPGAAKPAKPAVVPKPATPAGAATPGKGAPR